MPELPSCFANVPHLGEATIERRALVRLARLPELAFPIDVESLIELSEGLAVEHVESSYFDDPEPDRILGAYCFARKTVYINSDTVGPLTRERWTLAHEYGHHVLHADYFLQGDLFDGPTKESLKLHRGSVDHSDRMERQANLFAAHLLLPRELTLRAVAPLLVDADGEPLRRPVPYQERSAARAITRLHELAEVSRQAARIRLEELRAIAPTPRLPNPQ